MYRVRKIIHANYHLLIPMFFIVLFHGLGIVNGLIPMAQVYPLTMGEPSTGFVDNYNQDFAKGLIPYWYHKIEKRSLGESQMTTRYMESGTSFFAHPLAYSYSLTSLLSQPFGTHRSFSASALIMTLLMLFFANALLCQLNASQNSKLIGLSFLVVSAESLKHSFLPYMEAKVWLLASLAVAVNLSNNFNLPRAVRSSFLCGLFWGICFYANNPVYQASSMVVFFLISTALLFRSNDLKTSLWGLLALTAISTVVAVMIGMAQLLPTLDLIGKSFRSITPKTYEFDFFIRLVPFYFTKLQAIEWSWDWLMSIAQLPKFSAYPIKLIPHLDGHYLSASCWLLIAWLLLGRTHPYLKVKVFVLIPLAILATYNLVAGISQAIDFTPLAEILPFLFSVHPTTVVAMAIFVLPLSAGFAFDIVNESKLCRAKKVTVLMAITCLWVGYMGLNAMWSKHLLFAMEAYKLSTFRELFSSFLKLYSTVEVFDTYFRIESLIFATITSFEIWLIFSNRIQTTSRAVILAVLICSTGCYAAMQSVSWTESHRLLQSSRLTSLMKAHAENSRILGLHHPFTKQKLHQLELESAKRLPDVLLKYWNPPFTPALSLIHKVEDLRSTNSLLNLEYSLGLTNLRFETNSILHPKFSSELGFHIHTINQIHNSLAARIIIRRGQTNDQKLQLIGKFDDLFVYDNLAAKPRVWSPSSVSYSEKVDHLQPLQMNELPEGCAMIDLSFQKAISWVKNGVNSLAYNNSHIPNCAAIHQSKVESIEILEEGGVKAEVRSLNDSWVIFAERFDRAWQASVNNKPTPVYPANFLTTAVRVPPGKNIVKLTTASSGQTTLNLISTVSIALAFICIASSLLWEKKSKLS